MRRLAAGTAAGVALIVVVGAALVGFGTRRAHGLPIPLPYYSIEAVSGSHHVSLLNLSMGDYGVPEVPVPVDLDGDLLPDVTVSVNLINIAGVTSGLPPSVNAIVAPNVQIQRIPTAPLLGQASPPVRIDVVLTLKDSGGGPDTTARFGYDTGRGGSIPPFFQATLGGLTNLFNPLQAAIDTTGGPLGLQTGLTHYGLQATNAYQGPLTIVAGVTTGSVALNADLAYSPLPNKISVTYASDAKGLHLTYGHASTTPVDLNANVHLRDSSGSVTDIQSRVDRLPRSFAVDYGSGSLAYHSTSSGLAPDAQVSLVSTPHTGAPTVASIHLEGVPSVVNAAWSFASGASSASFSSGGLPLGAIEASIANYAGAPKILVPWVPSQDQYFNDQSKHSSLNGPSESLITARLERVSDLSFGQTAGGAMSVTSDAGDDVKPLQVHYAADQVAPTIQSIDTTAKADPLPGHVVIGFDPGVTNDLTRPEKVSYTSSATVDVTAAATIIGYGAPARPTCGAQFVTCAAVVVRDLPPKLSVAIGQGPPATSPTASETDVALDDTPGPGGIKPDVTVDATLGESDGQPDPNIAATSPVPTVLHALLVGIPSHVRLHEVVNSNKALNQLDLINCDLADGLAGTCATPATPDPIALAQIAVQNFVPADRPAGSNPLVVPALTAPNYASVASRGIHGTFSTVRTEALARLTQVKELRLVNTCGELGVVADAGGGSDLQVALDMQGQPLTKAGPPPCLLPNAAPPPATAPLPPPTTTGSTTTTIFTPVFPTTTAGSPSTTDPTKVALEDTVGSVLISPMPTSIQLCNRQPGLALTSAIGLAFTAPCESSDPFGDGSTTRLPSKCTTAQMLCTTPLTVAYQANAPFDTTGTLDQTKHDGAGTPSTLDANHVAFDLAHVPANLTLVEQSPPDAKAPQVTRVLVTAPRSTRTPAPDVDVTLDHTLGGANCNTVVPGPDASCEHVTAIALPQAMSVLASAVSGITRVEFHACDWAFLAATPACKADFAEGSIATVTATVHIVHLAPAALPVMPAPTKSQYVQVESYERDNSNTTDDAAHDTNLLAAASVNNVQDVVYTGNADGFNASTNVGSGADPIETYAWVETLAATRPQTTDQLMTGDFSVSPLPANLTLSVQGLASHGGQLLANFTQSATVPVAVTGTAAMSSPLDTTCGDALVICGDLSLINLPQSVNLVAQTVVNQIDTTHDTRDFTMTLDDTPTPGVAPPTLHLNATIGPGFGGTAPAGTAPAGPPPLPIVGVVTLFGFPSHVFVDADETETTSTVSGVTTVGSSRLDRADIETCIQSAASGPCVLGGPLATAAIDVRNFVLRPVGMGLPAIPVASSNYIVASMVNNWFEATAVAQQVTAIQMVSKPNTGAVGVYTQIGNGQPLHVQVDGTNVPIGATTLRGQSLDASATFHASADIGDAATDLPRQLTTCFQPGGSTWDSSGDPLTLPCESPTPFGPGSTRDAYNSPTVLAWSDPATNDSFNVAAASSLTVTPTDHTIAPLTVKATVGITGVPASLTATVLAPATTGSITVHGLTRLFPFVPPSGPLHVHVADPYGQPTTSPTVNVSIDYLDGFGTVCADPRQTVNALCFSATLANLPTTADLVYNAADKTVNNLKVTTTGPVPGQGVPAHTMDISHIELSDVTASATPGAPPNVLVVTGAVIHTGPSSGADIEPGASITGIPDNLTVDGMLNLPQPGSSAPPSILLQAESGVIFGSASAVIRNWIGPDPLAGVTVPVRPVFAGAVPDDEVSFLQRGEAFTAVLKIVNVTKVGYQTEVATDGSSLPTQVINVGFDKDHTVRAFADIEPPPPAGVTGPVAPQRILGDVTLQGVPASVDVCIRPPMTDAQASKVPLVASSCDPSGGTNLGKLPAPTPEQGQFAYVGTPSDGRKPFNADAYFRLQNFGATAGVIAAHTMIDGVPPTVQGEFGGPTQTLLAAGFTTPTSGVLAPFGSLAIDASSFDLDPGQTGYCPDGASATDCATDVGSVVGTPAIRPAGPFFQNPLLKGQYLEAGLTSSAFQVFGQIGGLGSTSTPLEDIILGATPCGAATYPARLPPDYPEFPASVHADGTDLAPSYTCVGADFQTAPDSLINLDIEKDDPSGNVVHLQDAGLRNVPAWFRATIAKSVTTDAANQDALIPVCGPAKSYTGSPTDATCIPPLLRFDQPSTTAQVFGLIESGKGANVPTVSPLFGEHLPAVVAPVANDGTNQWTDWCSGAQDTCTGVRASIVQSDDPNGGGNTLTDMVAAFRLAVPLSLTVDQPETWNTGDVQGSPSTESAPLTKGSDLHIHVAIRDSQGTAVQTAGDASIAFQDDKGKQILLGGLCDSTLAARGSDITSCQSSSAPGFDHGFSLPGEIDATIYTREDKRLVTVNSTDDTVRDSKFYQVDGYVNAPINATMRMLDPAADATIHRVELAVKGVPAGSDPATPSIRLRANIISDATAPGQRTPEPFVGFQSSTVVVGIPNLRASFDFGSAHQVDLVVDLPSSTKISVDIAGAKTIAATPSYDAALSANGEVQINPLKLDVVGKVDVHKIVGFVPQLVAGLLDHISSDLGSLLSKLSGLITDFVSDALDGILDAFPFEVRLDAVIDAQFTMTNASQLQVFGDVMHLKSQVYGGTAAIGPITMTATDLFAGLSYKITLHTPKWARALGAKKEYALDLSLIGLTADTSPVTPSIMPAVTFRTCAAVTGQVVSETNPLSLSPQDGEANVIAWPFGDLFSFASSNGFRVGGLIPDAISVIQVAASGGTSAAEAELATTALSDLVVQILGPPVLCKVFGADASDFITTTTQAGLYPGGTAAEEFAPQHFVPGQLGQLLYANDPGSATAPAPTRPTPSAPSAPVGAIVLPTTLSDPVSLCGGHDYGAPLIINTTVTVATAVDLTPGADLLPRCSADSVGSLYLVGQSITIGVGGKIVGGIKALTLNGDTSITLTGNAAIVGGGGAITLDAPTINEDEGTSITSNGTETSALYNNSQAPQPFPEVEEDNATCGSATPDDVCTYESTSPTVGGGHGSNGGSTARVPYQSEAYATDASDPTELPGYWGGDAGSVDTQFFSSFPEPCGFDGLPCGGTGGGGGGAIVLSGATVNVQGTVAANGADGGPDTSGFCQPDTDSFTGKTTYTEGSPVLGGGGGGAGGGIVLDGSTSVSVGSDAIVVANGGNGGPSWTMSGGPGGGGVIKVISPRLPAAIPAPSSGTYPQQQLANPPKEPDAHGNLQPCWTWQPGPSNYVLAGQSLTYSPPFTNDGALSGLTFWQPGSPGTRITVPVAGTAAGVSATTPMTIYLCGLAEATLGSVSAQDEEDVLQEDLQTFVPSDSAPCGDQSAGSNTDVATVPLGHTLSTTSPAPDDAAITFAGAAVGNNFVGLYTVVEPPNCASASCRSDLPLVLNGIIGVDASAPAAAISTSLAPVDGALKTNTPLIPITITASDALSGVASVQCASGPSSAATFTFTQCTTGTNLPYYLAGAAGPTTVEVEAVDVAGNISSPSSFTVDLTSKAPKADLAMTWSAGNRAWSSTGTIAVPVSTATSGPPMIQLSQDSTSQSTVISYQYAIDGGPEQTCTPSGATCTIPSDAQTLPIGAHTIEWTGVDALGNRDVDGDPPASPMSSVSFVIEDVPPTVGVATVPARPDGGAWYTTHPWIVLQALVPYDGSPVTVLRYTDNGVVNSYDPANPPQLRDGTHHICPSVTDAVGDTLAGACNDFNVDSTAPSAALAVNGLRAPVPTGLGRWFLAPPTLGLGGFGDAGSGAPVDGELRYRVDSKPYVTCAAACSVPALSDGKHIVAFSAVDAAGNRSSESGFEIDVDSVAPAVRVVTTPPSAGGANGWFTMAPVAQIGALDGPVPAGSGVAVTSYTLDGRRFAYTPMGVAVTDGAHTLCATATDNAGHASTPVCTPIHVDTVVPVAGMSTVPGSANGANGWFTSAPTVTPNGGDHGSGLVTRPGVSTATLCTDPAVADPAISSAMPRPAGICASVDGAPFAPMRSAPYALGAGLHTVSVFAVDAAGQRSPLSVRQVDADLTPPAAVVRTYPPDTVNGWLHDTCAPSPNIAPPAAADRCAPAAYLRAFDGDQGSGVTSLTYSLNRGPTTPYSGPVALPEGTNHLTYTAADAAGLVSTGTVALPVDVTPPVAQALAPVPGILLHLSVAAVPAQLTWTVREALSSPVHVTVLVYNVSGEMVDQVDGGVHPIRAGVLFAGSTAWDGTDHTLTAALPLGLYYYRIVATDGAGNTVQSGESDPMILVVRVADLKPVLPVLPPPLPKLPALPDTGLPAVSVASIGLKQILGLPL